MGGALQCAWVEFPSSPRGLHLLLLLCPAQLSTTAQPWINQKSGWEQIVGTYSRFLGRLSKNAIYRPFHRFFTISKDLPGQTEKAQRPQIVQSVAEPVRGDQMCWWAVLWVTLRVQSALGRTWLILGWAFVFFFEVVSRPHSEENLLLRLLQDRDMAWARRLTPISVRAATCGDRTEVSFTPDMVIHSAWMSRLGYYGGSRSDWLLHLAAATSIRATAALRWRRRTSISLIPRCRE